MVEVSLAEVLLEQGELGEAAAALAEVDVDGVATFNSNLFRYLVASARVASAGGDGETATSAAANALDLVHAAPQFHRHPTVGLVEADDRTVAELRALASTGR